MYKIKNLTKKTKLTKNIFFISLLIFIVLIGMISIFEFNNKIEATLLFVGLANGFISVISKRVFNIYSEELKRIEELKKIEE